MNATTRRVFRDTARAAGRDIVRAAAGQAAKPDDVVEVFNLRTAKYGPTYVGITPRQAVIAAYAQSRGDYNTWDYPHKYDHLVIKGDHCVACGDYSALNVNSKDAGGKP